MPPLKQYSILGLVWFLCQVFTGVVQETNHFPCLFTNGLYVFVHLSSELSSWPNSSSRYSLRKIAMSHKNNIFKRETRYCMMGTTMKIAKTAITKKKQSEKLGMRRTIKNCFWGHQRNLRRIKRLIIKKIFEVLQGIKRKNSDH